MRHLLTLLVIGLFWATAGHSAKAEADAAEALPLEMRKLTGGWRLFEGVILDPARASDRLSEAKSVSVPHIWRDYNKTGGNPAYGVGTYVLRLKLSAPARSFALRTGKMRTVYHLYAVVRGGDAAPQVYDLGGNGQPDEAVDDAAKGKLFVTGFPFGATEFDLVVQVSNHIFDHAGFLWAPTIGPGDEIMQGHDTRVAAAYGFTGLFIALGAITILLAAWHAGGRYYYIGGALLFVMAIRTLMVDNYVWVVWPDLALDTALRIEYIGLFLLGPGYYWLISELYPRESLRQLVISLWILCGVGIMISLFAPLPTMFRLRDPYILMSAMVLLLIVWVIYNAHKKKRAGAAWALWGIGAAITGMATDIYLYIPGPRTSVEAIPFAASAFTFVLLGLFTVRYRQEQEEKAFLAKCLEKANVELKEHADQLDDAQTQAAAALEMKNSFLSNISHEIQTPLRTIVKFADILTDASHTVSTPSERAEYLRLIRNNSANLSKMIEDILSVADLETGRFEVSPEPTDPKEIAEMVLAVVESVAHEKHILIDLKCDGAIMTIDQRLMRQALIKILSNAVKFSPVNGVVTMRGSKADKDFVFTIMDTGPGMEPGEVPMAMSLFHKVGGKGEGDESGLGLGLPLVARFMDLVGGSMQIDSIPELGTTVTLSFPMTPPVSTRS